MKSDVQGSVFRFASDDDSNPDIRGPSCTTTPEATMALKSKSY